MSTPTEKKTKVLLAKSDQDAHDRGTRYVAKLVAFLRVGSRVASGLTMKEHGYRIVSRAVGPVMASRLVEMGGAQ